MSSQTVPDQPSEQPLEGGALPRHEAACDGTRPFEDETAWVLEGQLVEASNAVFRLRAEAGDIRAVYKPVRGERPLADFPPGTLAHREVASWLVSDAGGWGLVPYTQWFEGPAGPGSLQRWVGPLTPQESDHVLLVSPQDANGADLCLITAFETDDGPALLAHDDSEQLAHLAAFDVITNNADRKGSHLIDDGATIYAIDNGLTFHEDDKLRTVLWGWSGQHLPQRVVAHLQQLVERREVLAEQLREHLSGAEIQAFHVRTDALLAAGTFPEPPEERYGLPWPPL